MLPVIQNSPLTAALRTAIAALFLSISFSYFAPSASAQAYVQLQQAAGVEEGPEVPSIGGATMLAAAPGLNVYFVNVGQGDAIYIELPGGQNALIDGGPSSSANGPLAKFLAEKNVTKLDRVVLTHPHSDHYKGLQYVISALPVGEFYDTRMNNTGTQADDNLRAAAAEKGAKPVYPAPGDSYSWGGAAVKVFNSCPQAASSGDGNVINDCSITIRLSYQNTSLLFVGDTEADVEASMVAKYGSELRSDVLKVGHHGSAYSSSQVFLDAVQPKKAYIEVGKNNYGHPVQSTLNRIAAMGTKIFRTDLEGTLEFSPAADLARYAY